MGADRRICMVRREVVLGVFLIVIALACCCGCGNRKSNNGSDAQQEKNAQDSLVTWESGEFRFDYPAAEFELTGEQSEENLVSFKLCRRDNAANRIECNVYRYDPAFVRGIRPDQIAGEIKADVRDIRERLAGMLKVVETSELIYPEDWALPYEATGFLRVRADDGDELIIRVTSAQIAHYNVITIAWGDSPETMRAYADILSTFRVIPTEE